MLNECVINERVSNPLGFIQILHQAYWQCCPGVSNPRRVRSFPSPKGYILIGETEDSCLRSRVVSSSLEYIQSDLLQNHTDNRVAVSNPLKVHPTSAGQTLCEATSSFKPTTGTSNLSTIESQTRDREWFQAPWRYIRPDLSAGGSVARQVSSPLEVHPTGFMSEHAHRPDGFKPITGTSNLSSRSRYPNRRTNFKPIIGTSSTT